MFYLQDYWRVVQEVGPNHGSSTTSRGTSQQFTLFCFFIVVSSHDFIVESYFIDIYIFLLTDIPTNSSSSTEGAIKELRSKRSMSRTEVMFYEDERNFLVNLELNRSARMTFYDLLP